MVKFLKFFDNNVQRSTYELSEQYVSPYVSAIKGINGGVEPRYNVSSNVPPNVPPNALCILTLKDNSTIYITGENKLNIYDLGPYKDNVVRAIITNRCTTIGNGTFSQCNRLSSITIPDSVTSIGNSAFYTCLLLSNISIPDSVTSIGSGAFDECTSLSSVTLSNNITTIGSLTFDKCKSLEHISLPNTLKIISLKAFSDSGLKELIIPEGVTRLGKGSVQSCPNLESVIFPSSIEKVIKDDWFRDCDKLREIKVMGKKNLSDILPFDRVNNKSDLTLYVDSSLVDTYKTKRDSVNGQYKVLPLE